MIAGFYGGDRGDPGDLGTAISATQLPLDGPFATHRVCTEDTHEEPVRSPAYDDAPGKPREEGHGERARLLGRGWALHQARPAGRLAPHHGVQERQRVLLSVPHAELGDWRPSPRSSLSLLRARLVSSISLDLETI